MTWAPDYVTDAELGAFVKIPEGDTADAEWLALAAAAASRAVDRHCHRQFGVAAGPVSRRYTAWYNRRRRCWVVDIDDLMADDLVLTIDGVEVTGFTLEPVNADADGRPYEAVAFGSGSSAVPTGDEYEISATATWGWAAVPDAIKQAALLQGSRFFTRRSAPFGVAGSPDTGSEIRLLDRVDPDVAVSLADYVRDPVVFA